MLAGKNKQDCQFESSNFHGGGIRPAELEMTSPVEDLIKKSLGMRESGRLDEAIIAARRATTVDPDNANSWWQLGLAVSEKDGAFASIPHFKKTVELSDGFAYGWHRLGAAYKKTGMLEQAIGCWETAIENDDDRIDSLYALADAYQEREFGSDEDKRFEVLKLLDAKGEIRTNDLNPLGIAYYKKKDHHKAIHCYRRFAALDSGPTGYFNLGLALSAPEVSQDADAVDAWRRALEKDPTYERAKERLTANIPHLIELRSRVLARNDQLIDQSQWYINYINPFELLNLTEVENPFDLEIKTIQRAKKALLQEIDIENGLVEWVPGLRTDRSQAIKVSDGLTNEIDRYWHHLVYQNKDLLEFLSRGRLDHFLIDPDESPMEMLESIQVSPGEFEELLGERFAAQFDLLLSKAIEKREVDLIEAMLDGRRWVSPQQEDKCFVGALRQINQLIEPLRQASGKSEKIKPSVESVLAVLAQGHMGRIVGMLPTSFQTIQNEAATLIRSIVINACNGHGDADLAKEILAIGKTLASKSPSLLHKLDEDMKALDDRIKSESKDEASLTYQGSSYSITRKAVTFGKQSLPVADVRTLRWGITVSRSGAATTNAFTFAVGGRGSNVLTLNWSTSKDLEASRALFNKFVDASFSYLMPRVLEMIRADLNSNQTIRIGAAPVSKNGITFTVEGWFSNKQELCPWHRLRSEIDTGEVVITDSSNSKCKIWLPLATVDNAIALHFLIKNHS